MSEPTEPLRAERDRAIEECAQWHDQQYIYWRDCSPRCKDGLITAIAGAHMAAHRESARALRALKAAPPTAITERIKQEKDRRNV